MKDFIISIFKTSEERIKNPFIGTFLISFIAFNWKAISIFFFSQNKIEDRIVYISNNFSNLTNLLVLPILISLFYVIGLPYIMVWIENITFKSFKLRLEHVYKSKDLDLDGKKHILLKELEIEDLRSNYKDKADLNRQIDSFSKELENKNFKISTLENELISEQKINNELQIKLNDNKEKLYELESKNSEYLRFYNQTPTDTILDFVYNFTELNNHHSDRLEYLKPLIERWTFLELIEKNEDHNTNDETNYKITNKGIFLIKQASQEGLI